MENSLPLIQTTLVTAALVFITVWLHYEILLHWPKIENVIAKKPRGRILRLVLTLVVLHTAEILLFGFGYWYLSGVGSAGSLTSINALVVSDYFYYSAAVYTTVGFGDITPLGMMRMLTSIEALVGLILITWSASFTFLEMQRFWNR